MMEKRELIPWALDKRYLTVGVGVYIFELLVIVVAQHQGASAVLAVAVSFWLGLIVSFILQKVITFKDKRTHHKVLTVQIIAFSALVLFNFGFTLVLTRLVSPPLPAVAARTIALAITTSWNFYLYKRHIFRMPISGEDSSS